jgi:hypothetical protein
MFFQKKIQRYIHNQNFNILSTNLHPISFQLNLNSIIELEFTSIQFQFQSMYLNSIQFKILNPIHLNLNSIQFKVHGMSLNIFIQMEHKFQKINYYFSSLIITIEQHKAQMNL